MAVVFLVGALTGVRMPAHVWLLSGVAAWLCSLVFAAFGLFMGFLLPSENVMQYVGPLLAILAVFGGLLVPLEVFSHTLQEIAKFTPVYGVGVIARSPLVGGFTATAVANVLIWTALFGFGAMLAGFAGIMVAPILSVEPGMGDQILILAFVVIVIGGIGSIRGAFLAAILVGVIDTLGRSFMTDLLREVLAAATARTIGPALASMSIYLLMAVVLAVRPAGLFPGKGRA